MGVDFLRFVCQQDEQQCHSQGKAAPPGPQEFQGGISRASAAVQPQPQGQDRHRILPPVPGLIKEAFRHEQSKSVYFINNLFIQKPSLTSYSQSVQELLVLLNSSLLEQRSGPLLPFPCLPHREADLKPNKYQPVLEPLLWQAATILHNPHFQRGPREGRSRQDPLWE